MFRNPGFCSLCNKKFMGFWITCQLFIRDMFSKISPDIVSVEIMIICTD
jgi:hypothetical protein